ncbi:hypothetical protein [Streptomyces sp. NPDC049040]|uniref:hypothetical protein n=1 Tax=Streptomyces sp. NPDC049040 TaxID=3365593 RepID=UPI003720CB27
MRRITELLARHLWLEFLAAWLLASAFVLLLRPGDSPLALLLRVMVCFVAVLWPALMRRHQERSAAGGSADELVVLDHLLREGEPPEDQGRRRVMRAIVERRLKRTRHRMPALLGVALLLVASLVLVAATSSPWHTAGYGAFCAVFLGYLYVAGGVAVHRLRRMRDALAEAAAPRGSMRHPIQGGGA